jgi:predicted MFS family arabinose efflux permease
VLIRPTVWLLLSATKLDGLGIVRGPLAFASISFGVSQSTVAGWTAASTLGGIGLGVAALALFVWRELSTVDPVIDLRVFGSRDFALGILAQWTAVAAMFGTFFLIPLFLHRVRGYGAFETGFYTLPTAIASAAFMQIGGRVFDRVGVRPPVLLGMALIATAMWLLSGLRGQTSGEDLRLPLVLLGAGMGSMMMALNTYLLNSAPRELVGRVTSLTSALQNVVASLAIATFATILQARIAQAGSGRVVVDFEAFDGEGVAMDLPAAQPQSFGHHTLADLGEVGGRLGLTLDIDQHLHLNRLPHV